MSSGDYLKVDEDYLRRRIAKLEAQLAEKDRVIEALAKAHSPLNPQFAIDLARLEVQQAQAKAKEA